MLKVISALLGKAKFLIPALTQLLRWDFMEVIARAWPLVVQLVKEFEDVSGVPGPEKAKRVKDQVLALLATTGFVVNPDYDWIINIAIELALFFIRGNSVPEGAPVQSVKRPANLGSGKR